MMIESVEDLMPGDVGFYTIAGRVGGFVSIGQALLRDECWFTHAFIVGERYENGTAMIVEAMPHGARRVGLVGTDRCGPGYGWARLPLTLGQRASVSEYANATIGTPYSFLDYLSLSLLHLGLPRKLTAGRVTSSGHMICSQLVDYVLCRAGFHLFADGRLSQDVTPGALFRRAGAVGSVTWW
jgi:hypothetical protein